MSVTATLHVYDDVTLGLIPRDAKYVGVYVDGIFSDVARARADFPHATLIPITVFGKHGTRWADCERGDMTNVQVAAWARDEIHAGRRPGIYTSVSNIMAVVAELRVLGISHTQVDFWSAHYTGQPHVCGPQCGFNLSFVVGGTQFTDRSHGISLDESLFFATVLGAKPPTAPAADVYAFHPDNVVKWKGKSYRERTTIKTYDRLIKHRLINWRKLTLIKADLLELADRVLFVAEHKPDDLSPAGKLAKPRWNTNHLGEREQALLHRAQGKKVL